MEKIRVLVLGVGGNVSQGVLKSLSHMKIPVHVTGGCISPESMGLYTTDKAIISPYANDPHFLNWIIKTCQNEKIQIIFSGVEQILKILSEHKKIISIESGAIPIVCNPEVLSIANDKLSTCEWLKSHNFHFPHYAPSKDLTSIDNLKKQCGYPLLAKPRFGKGSQGIMMISTDEELEMASSLEDYVIQEYLESPDTEYSVGCFCDKEYHVCQSLTFRRKLLQGTTSFAKIEESDLAFHEAKRIVEKLKPMGPCNIQLRISKGKAVCFEINARFSGTTPIRAHFGFNDVELSIRHFLLHENIETINNPVKEGIAIRYWNELYIDPASFRALENTLVLDNPGSYEHSIERYGMSE